MISTRQIIEAGFRDFLNEVMPNCKSFMDYVHILNTYMEENSIE